MNIFALSDCPIEAAQFQCNKHVVKMIIETVQILSTVSWQRGVPAPYKPTHAHHPSTKWTATCGANYAWLLSHGFALVAEYEKRYGKIHTCLGYLCKLCDDYEKVWPGDESLPRDHTPFAMAMPEEWKSIDPVESYRAYYIAEKSKFAQWEPRARQPPWWPFSHGEMIVKKRKTKNVS